MNTYSILFDTNETEIHADGTVTSSRYLWGAQQEQGPVITRHFPTEELAAIYKYSLEDK